MHALLRIGKQNVLTRLQINKESYQKRNAVIIGLMLSKQPELIGRGKEKEKESNNGCYELSLITMDVKNLVPCL